MLITFLYACWIQARYSTGNETPLLFALIKMAHIVAEARGSIAGTVFSRNTYGAYLRQKVSPINKQSVSQQVVRQYLAQLAQAWRGLTQAQRDGWNQGAVNFSRTNVFGDQVQLTGFNLYMRLNKNLLDVGQSVISAAPSPGSVGGFTSASIDVDNTAGDMDITFAPAIASGQSVLVMATAPLSQGKDFAKSELRQVDVLTNADASPVDLTTAYVAKFGAAPPDGTKIFVTMKTVDDTTGQAGVPIKFSAIAASP